MRKGTYFLALTRDEYCAAVYMSARGYLGEVTEHASTIQEWPDGGMLLHFSEPAAWTVRDVCEADPHAVWALTTPGTTLGRKFAAFLERIV